MRRLALGFTVMAFLLGLWGSGAEAQRNKRHKAKAQPPQSAAIAPALGDLQWGMSRDEVIKLLAKQVRERYRLRIAKTTDAIEEDRLQRAQQREMKQIREGYVRFDGASTGWDLGYLRDEFTHHNGEAMLTTKDSNSQNFYFFINGRLWKWYKAFDISVFEGRAFDEFAAAVQRKFGKGKSQKGELAPGSGVRQWLEWKDDDTRLRAIDQTAFYGFYCLVFEDANTLAKLATLRSTEPQRRSSETHKLVEAVTSTSAMAADPDRSPDIADRITGKVRSSRR